MEECLGYPVEILSMGTGESLDVPVAMITLRPNPDTCLESLPILFTQQQCVRLRDTLDNFLCNPESWFHLSFDQQAAFGDNDEHDVWDEIVPMLERFAELPEDTEESQFIRKRLTKVKMVVTTRLLFYADSHWKLSAACALARIDAETAAIVLPTLMAGLQSDSEVDRASAAVACRSLGPRALPAIDVLTELLKKETVEAVREPAEEALARIGTQ